MSSARPVHGLAAMPHPLLRALFVPAVLLGAVALGCNMTGAAPGPQSSSPATDPAPDGGSWPWADGGTTAADPLSPAYVDYAINHVLTTGQSNGLGNGGTPPLTMTQPFSNLMFDGGPMSMSNCDGDGCYHFDTPTSFVPLVEGDRYFDYAAETPSSGLANEISHLAIERYHFGTHAGYPAKHDVLVSAHGRSGNTYWCLRKGSCNYHPDTMVKAYSQGMLEVQTAKQIAAAAGRSYVVRAVVNIHGESDHSAYATGHPEFPLPGSDGTPGKINDYSDALLEWQHDYETDVVAITGQTVALPMLISQLGGWIDGRTSKLAQLQLDAHIRAPGKVVLVTPTYPLGIREDCLHYDSTGERTLGEYFAKAYTQIVFSGQPWEPLRPATITRNGDAVTVRFLVPKPPLVFDTQRVTNPGSYGFEIIDATGAALPLTDVSITSPDTVTIRLAAPGGTRIRYAQNQPDGACIGPGTVYPGGARGNLRDSDDTPAQSGDDLFNWSVSFDLPL